MVVESQTRTVSSLLVTLLFIVPVLSLSAWGCATNPATGQRQFSLMSEEQELRIGQEQDVEVRREMGVYEDRGLQEYISGIGLRLAQHSERPNLPWHYTVVDVPAVNAFALPGGYIYITRGILPFLDNEAQLACVLGHETGHVNARHAAQQYTKSTGAGLGVLLGSIFVPELRPFGSVAESGLGVLMLKYSRDDELQADQLGVKYASRAGWDPSEMPRMLTTLGRLDEATDNKGVPNWLATHPAAENRVERVLSEVQLVQTPGASFVTNRDDYLHRVDGVVYGDNPDQGVVRGNSFLHKGLRFAVDFPQGWDVTNGQNEVVAKEPGTHVFMALEPIRRAQGRTIEDVALLSMQRAGFRNLDGGRTTINGLDAFLGTYQGTLRDAGRVRLRAAHIIHDRSVYLLAGVAPVDTYDREEAALSKSVQSFRPLTRAEAEALRPNRIGFYTARPGDSWQSIAEHEGHALVKATTLAIMNGHAVNDQPRAGDRLKIVIPG
jgi:predicted Zn-dependent protease